MQHPCFRAQSVICQPVGKQTVHHLNLVPNGRVLQFDVFVLLGDKLFVLFLQRIDALAQVVYLALLQLASARLGQQLVA